MALPWDEHDDALDALRDAQRAGDAPAEEIAATDVGFARDRMARLGYLLLQRLVEDRPGDVHRLLGDCGVPDPVMTAIADAIEPLRRTVEQWAAESWRLKHENTELRKENWELGNWVDELQYELETLRRIGARDGTEGPNRHREERQAAVVR